MLFAFTPRTKAGAATANETPAERLARRLNVPRIVQALRKRPCKCASRVVRIGRRTWRDGLDCDPSLLSSLFGDAVDRVTRVDGNERFAVVSHRAPGHIFPGKMTVVRTVA